MSWPQIAEEVLAAAAGSGVPVERTLVAAGSMWARDCRMIAVHPERVTVVEPVPRSGRLPLGQCAHAPQLHLIVTFVADCAPLIQDSGDPPHADDITAWSTQFLADGQAVWAAVAEAADDLGFAGLGCDTVRLGETQIIGPQNGIAQMQIPVAVVTSESFSDVS